MQFSELIWTETKFPKGRIARLRINGKPASVVQNEHIRAEFGPVAYQLNYTNKHRRRKQKIYFSEGLNTQLHMLDCAQERRPLMLLTGGQEESHAPWAISEVG